MIRTSVLAIVCASASLASAQPSRIEVTTREARSSQRGSPQTFTGSVLVDQLFGVKEGTHATGGHVTFEPGARSAWHSHPAGQVLIVTAGVGLVQEWQGAPGVITEGDVVWTPPGVKHWHGATATRSMTHIAIQEAVNGQNVTWLEHVTDAQYTQAAAAANSRQQSTMPTSDALRTVAPALPGYAATTLDDLWKRPALSPRDRSLVTVSALVARQNTAEMATR